MDLTYDRHSKVVTLNFMSSGEEIRKELDLTELETLRKDIDKCLTKLGKRSVTDKDLFNQMQKLISAAEKQVEKWREENYYRNKEPEYYQDVKNYRDGCYAQIWDKFWQLHNQITASVEYYYSDTDHYTDINACFNAYKEIEWVLDATD